MKIFSSIKKKLDHILRLSGERQVAPELGGIRKDHIGRYIFACRFIKEGDVVLDCACGVGYGAYIMAEKTKLSNTIAVDKERSAIKYARKYYFNPKIDYRVEDILSLDIADDHFDVIVSFETIEHVDGKKAVEIFHKMLKTGGLFIVSTPNQNKLVFNKKDFPFHLRHYTPEEFEELLSRSGFKIRNRVTQYNRESEEVSEGWEGLYNIAVTEKI